MSALFVHIPKCAGTSVRSILEANFPNRLELSYESYFRVPMPERTKIIAEVLENPVAIANQNIVYGHFLPIKHLGKNLDRSVKLTTILRDPLERMRSHYVFWNAGVFEHYLWDKMKAQNWSFSDFAFSPEMRNFYSQYSIHVPVERYDYIGLYENLEVSVRGCFAALGLGLPNNSVVPHTNASQEQPVDLISRIDRDAFRQWHAEDYAFYGAAKQLFHNT
jgi:hypothetical protein